MQNLIKNKLKSCLNNITKLQHCNIKILSSIFIISLNSFGELSKIYRLIWFYIYKNKTFSGKILNFSFGTRSPIWREKTILKWILIHQYNYFELNDLIFLILRYRNVLIDSGYEFRPVTNYSAILPPIKCVSLCVSLVCSDYIFND